VVERERRRRRLVGVGSRRKGSKSMRSVVKKGHKAKGINYRKWMTSDVIYTHNSYFEEFIKIRTKQQTRI
jgi:hypothetical protein